MLGLRQGPRVEDPACRLLRGDHRHVEAGDVIDFEGSITVTALDGTDHSTPRRYDEEAGGRLTASGPLTVEIEPVPYTGPGSNVYVCARSGTR